MIWNERKSSRDDHEEKLKAMRAIERCKHGVRDGECPECEKAQRAEMERRGLFNVASARLPLR